METVSNTEELDYLRAERDTLRKQLAQKEEQLTRTQDDLRRAIAESYALYLTSLDIDSQLDLSAALSSVLRRIMSLTGTNAGAIYLVDDQSGAVFLATGSNVPPTQEGDPRYGEDIAKEVLLASRALLIDDYTVYPNRTLSPGEDVGLYATVALPLHWQGKIIGVTILHHTVRSLKFSLDDLDSLQHIAVQAAIAIHNARTFDQEKQRGRRLALLYQGVSRITGSLDSDAVTRAASEVLISILGVAGCSIYEYRGQAQPAALACYIVSAGGKLDIIKPPTIINFPRSAVPLVETGLWVVYQKSDARPTPDVTAYLETRRAQSMVIVPIMLGQRAIGFIELYESREARRFAPADIETAQALASHIGIAIRHAQLHHESQAQRINEQTMLLKLARSLLATTHAQQVAEKAVETIIEAFSARTAALYLLDAREERFELRASIGMEPGAMDILTLKGGTESPESYALLTHELVILEDVFTEQRFRINPQMVKNGMRSGLIVPLIHADRVIGLLRVCRSEPRGFSPDDAQLFSLLAFQTVVALERARLFETNEQYTEMLEARIDDRVRQIRAEQERAEAILQAAGEALIVFDQDGYIQRVNAAFEHQHGYSAAEALQKHSTEIFTVDLREQGTFSERDIWRGEMRMTRRNATTYDAAVTLSRMYDPSGHVLGIVASIRDISYLKELDRMKDKFISSVSHELRTPLANMKLYQHLMMKGYEQRRDHYFGILQRETERLQRLIEDLLMLSRLDSRTVVPTLHATNINAVVGTLIDDRMALINSRGLDIEYHLQPGELTTLVDQNMVMQAVTNLVDNAVNYTPSAGKIKVRTFLEHIQGYAPMIVISVADTGMGMSETDQEKLFDRFYRGTAALETGAAGTGLGMAIVKEIMERHGGSVTFTSVQGKGTTFFLRLPVRSEGN